ncbi:MAG TPA: 50S ribosomal protein L9, partial [Acidobacteria bacterium]|nr:50S ribosomal protein L9 [Acidobacteriota bacterium]
VRDEEEKQVAVVFAERLSQVVCVIARRVGETDTLFGSVTSSDVAACLAEQSMEVDRRKIQLDEPLKKLGDHIVPIKVHREVTAEVTVRIVKEGAVVGDIDADAEPAPEAGDAESDTASHDDA